MPRSKRDVRAAGVTRSLGGTRAQFLTCINCERHLPRDAIAFIRRKPVEAGPHKGKPFAVCGECYRVGSFIWNS